MKHPEEADVPQGEGTLRGQMKEQGENRQESCTAEGTLRGQIEEHGESSPKSCTAEGSLWDQLEEYCKKGLYPFHMPGHKRRMAPAPKLPFSWDLTEVPGVDDLHDAQGILLEAMRRTARLWGSDRTWYLVNGSTCGLLAGIRALARPGSEVICARNCHKAVYHALELASCRVHWLLPPVDPDWGICGSIGAGQVEAAIRKHPNAAAVILTSPTYEGILSAIADICKVCHEKGIPVLVDEAHGAHLMPASERAGFPQGALAGGADLVVQSPHKTLPSLTQTALLHRKGTCVDTGRIEEELDVFETSSPSYPLMASLDGCTGILARKGEELFDAWAGRLARFALKAGGLKNLRILNQNEKSFLGRSPLFYAIDPGKILIDGGGAGLTGDALACILREKYGMETEMSAGNLVLAMTSVCDNEYALDRLAAALLEIDAQAGEAGCGPGNCKKTGKDDAQAGEAGCRPGNCKKTGKDDAQAGEAGYGPGICKNTGKGSARAGEAGYGSENCKKTGNADCWPVKAAEEAENKTDFTRKSLFLELSNLKPAAACTLAQARAQEAEAVPLEAAQDRICAEYLYFYPPGIPFLAPGELISSKALDLLQKARACGLIPYRKKSGGGIRCLRE